MEGGLRFEKLPSNPKHPRLKGRIFGLSTLLWALWRCLNSHFKAFWIILMLCQRSMKMAKLKFYWSLKEGWRGGGGGGVSGFLKIASKMRFFAIRIAIRFTSRRFSVNSKRKTRCFEENLLESLKHVEFWGLLPGEGIDVGCPVAPPSLSGPATP